MVVTMIALLIFGCGSVCAYDEKPFKTIERHDVTPLELPESLAETGVPVKISRGRIKIDKIVARVNGENICASDLRRPRLVKDGQPYSLDEAVREKIFIKRAREIFVEPHPTDVERHIVALKNQPGVRGFSDKEFEDELKRIGFTIDEYKRQLMCMMAAERVKQAEIGEKLAIVPQDVLDYYTAHPEYQEEMYHLQLAYLSDEQSEKFRKQKDVSALTWIDLGWIARNELAQEYLFVQGMKRGGMSKLMKTTQPSGRHKIIRVLDKQPRQLKTLDSRYVEIERMLYYRKREQLFSELDRILYDRSVIVEL